MTDKDIKDMTYGQRQILAEGIRIGAKQENDRIVKSLKANYLDGRGLHNLLVIVNGGK